MDLLRGLSAIAVLIAHVRALFFVDYRTLPAPSLGMRALYLVTGFQHQAVVVFFVLSGFFIGTSVLRSCAANQWSWGNYLTRRFTRLYVVLVPALILTLLLDTAGMHVFGTDNVYGGRIDDAPLLHLIDARAGSGLTCFLGNLAFLQYIFVPPYGTNSPLWSLGYEFWSYVAFPPLVIVAARSSSMRSRAGACTLALLILIFGARDFISYFGMWLFGAAVAGSWKRVSSTRLIAGWMVAIGFVVFITLLTVARVTVSHPVLRDYMTSAVTAGFLLLLLSRTPGRLAAVTRGWYMHFAAGLAGFSYTLYLVHFPLLALTSAALVGAQRWQPTGSHLAVAALLCSLILVVAYALAQITERHTETVRVKADAVRASISGRLVAWAAKSA